MWPHPSRGHSWDGSKLSCFLAEPSQLWSRSSFQLADTHPFFKTCPPPAFQNSRPSRIRASSTSFISHDTHYPAQGPGGTSARGCSGCPLAPLRLCQHSLPGRPLLAPLCSGPGPRPLWTLNYLQGSISVIHVTSTFSAWEAS